MNTTIRCFGTAAIAALALSGCVHITNTYTGYPGQNESGATRTVAANADGRGNCGCPGTAPAGYPQAYAPNPNGANPTLAYYPPPYYYYPQVYNPGVINESPNGYYPYYPQPVYIPYDGGGSTGNAGSPQMGGAQQPVPVMGGSAPPIADDAPRGYESHERRPAEPQAGSGTPVRSSGPDLQAGSAIGGRAPARIDERPRTDAPQADAHPRRETHSVLGGASPSAPQTPISYPSTPRTIDTRPDRSPTSRSNADAHPRQDVSTGERAPSNVVEHHDAVAPQHGGSDMASPAQEQPPAQPTSHVQRQSAPATVTPATPSQSDAHTAPPATRPAGARAGNGASNSSAAPAPASSRVHRVDSATDAVTPAAAPVERATTAVPAGSAGSTVRRAQPADSAQSQTSPGTAEAGAPQQ
jgi:hypothetical protein